jgi:hypothetical protein
MRGELVEVRERCRVPLTAAVLLVACAATREDEGAREHHELAPGEQAQDSDEPPDFAPVGSRWYAPGRARRIEGIGAVEPAEYDEVNRRGDPLNPYRQNLLKGDFPLPGTEDLFLSIGATERFLAEVRNVPTPTGNSGPSSEFFGDGQQTFLNNDVVLELDFFKGPQAFQPVDWRLKAAVVYNHNELDVEERGVVFADVTRGTDRDSDDVALQEAFVEYHLKDLGPRYDFITSEVGIFPFRSDFRGFVFDDVNLGARLLGNWDENRWQYNLAYFDMLDKDTNSLLNEFEDRDQQVAIANVFRQDWPWPGYTTSLSVHYNHDERGAHFDDNGFLVSPKPVGLARENEVESYYLGWAGEGHVGRWNVTHALYQALGEEEQNEFAAREVDIDAQLVALELSRDFDWWRPRVYGLWASGDDDANDGDAEGFDAIVDSTSFAGGEFSFFNSQAIKLLGVNLTNPGSFLPDLQSSKFEGQSNFVNPGLLLVGFALQAELTPRWRGQTGINYLRFDETAVLESYLELPRVERDIGVELFAGTQFRPLLTNNVIVNIGVSGLQPGNGFERIYQDDETLYTVFVQTLLNW